MAVLLGSTALLVSGCASLKPVQDDTAAVAWSGTLQEQSLKSHVVRAPKIVAAATLEADDGPAITRTDTDLGVIPSLVSPEDAQIVGGDTNRPRLKAKKVDAFVAPLILPEFIDVVFGGMLKTPYVTGPEVANSTAVVQLRSSGEMKSTDFLALVSTALEEYGVRVTVENGAYRILQDASLRSRIPQFIKGRARLRTRADLRPVIQFVELQALDSTSMVNFLTQAFGQNNKKITIGRNMTSNYVILSGLPEDVDAALVIIRQLDELRYAGTQIRRYTPRYWNVKELTKALTTALTVEGWQVTDQSLLTRTIFLMPVAYTNDLFVFTHSEQANERVDRWLKEFDRPIDGGNTEQIYIYQVKNVDAALLAETANAALSGQSGVRTQTQTASSAASRAQTGTQSGASSRRQGVGGTFTVDTMGNRIIFSGTMADYDKMVGLLRQLDTPAPEVLIEVQIAEVTLTDNTSFGVEFFIDDLGTNDVGLTVGSSGLGQGGSGLNVGILSGNVEASLNAFATNRRVKILSRPILVARSGSAAELQVGTDVPIITSQRAANNQNGTGATDILQAIEYRSTGVILSIEPIVFSDNRIDLTISQEVSSAIDVQNSSISSPTISNRSFHTILSLEDGETAVLGGLIQETRILDEKGIPILKDIPGIGALFSNDSLSVDRTELVVLITAYVLRGQADKAQFVNHLSQRVDGFMSDDSRFETLLPKHF